MKLPKAALATRGRGLCSLSRCSTYDSDSRSVRSAGGDAMFFGKTAGLFLVTAIAEIVGCYLPYLWLRQGRTPWLLAPAAVSLAFFAWLLSLHPAAAGRVYAAYGGVYVVTAIFW